MSEIKVLNLEKFLPLYDFKADLLQTGIQEVLSIQKKSNDNTSQKLFSNLICNDVQDEGEIIFPKWLNNRIKIGDYGERIVEAYLRENIMGKIERVSLKNSSIGYDIEVKYDDNCFEGYEVKTTKSKNYNFQITINELNVAKTLKENYNIFYVQIDEKNESITGYIIKNPIDVLNIDVDKITHYIECNNIYIMPNKFIVKFNANYLTQLSTINLNSYKKRIKS